MDSDSPGGRPSRWAQAWRRLMASQDDIAADGTRHLEGIRAPGADALCDCRVRSKVCLQGTVTMTTLTPSTTRNWLEATLDDGTGVVTLIWMGRRSIPGVEAGRRMRVEGRLADDRGRQVIYNPQYQLLG